MFFLFDYINNIWLYFIIILYYYIYLFLYMSFYNYILKYICIGDSCVGKSSIISRFFDDRYQDIYEKTTNINVASKIKDYNIFESNIQVKIKIWDLPGD